MPTLLGPKGQPISSEQFKKKGTTNPLVGEIAVPWTGLDKSYMRLPGDNILQFDVSRLKLSDFRLMRNHYQINSSLSLLTFMLHQVEYKIECDSAKTRKGVEKNLEAIWTRLVRAMSQAFWAGFSPNALQWENDIDGRRKTITKVKDLYPEECLVHWKKIDGVAPKGEDGRKVIVPKIPIYDGIDQKGFPTIPVENSFWYPLLMENGNYYGRRLLNAAFQPWYFSLLNHVYTNRYFERFGEPVPIGRAPYEDTKNINGEDIQGNILLSKLMGMARSGAAVVLPNDKIQDGTENSNDYEYTIEYLESQMRGADFDRYLDRLDTEMSMAIFTPTSVMKDTSSGYNSGIVQMQTYMYMLNAVLGDMKEYIDKYILAPMALQNGGSQSSLPTIKFKRMGGVQQETLKAMIVALISGGKLMPNVEDMGRELGMDLKEIKEVQQDIDPEADMLPEGDPRKTRPERTVRPKGVEKAAPVAGKIAARIAEQHGSSKHSGPLTLGHSAQLTSLFAELEIDAPVEDFITDAETWITAIAEIEDDTPSLRAAVETGIVEQVKELIPSE